MEFRLFDKPDYKAGRPGDAAWYKDRAVSDHIREPGHRQRLLQAYELICPLLQWTTDGTVSDWGAGNGGLLHELMVGHNEVGTCWGYDMSPLAVKWGVEKYGVDLSVLDVTKWSETRKAGNIVVLTEFLEHLVDPHDLVRQITGMTDVAQFVVASVPAAEDPRNPYEFHLWAWHEDSFAKVFELFGWRIWRHFYRLDCGTQFLVVGR